MSTLDDIINSTENLEIKRALAIKMFFSDFKVEDICKLLNVSDSFVSKWKMIYENKGASALKVKYQGGPGYLTEQQRIQILLHLNNQPHCSVEELRDYIEDQFGIVYQSKQSYYDLLKAGGLTWHQTQAVNPQRDEQQVLQKREAIKKNWRRVKRKSYQAKLLFLLKMSVTWSGVTRSVSCGASATSGRKFRLLMRNNDRPIMAL